MASSSSSSSTSNNNNNSNNNSNDGIEDIPICCEFVKEIGLFRILRAKGKALASGGFGVAIAEPGSKNDSAPEEVVLSPPTKPAATGTTNHHLSKPSDFLFIEEVIFLFERGLLQCLAPNSSSSTTTATTACLDSSQLYQLLLPLGVSLPIYFAYAHLRKQDYRVLRHAPERLALLQQQQQQDTSTSYQQTQSLRHQVRDSIQRAAPPTIQQKDDDAPTTIAWDVYSPNSDFAKTKPGIPDFYVAVSYFNVPSLSFQQLQTLLVTKCHGIPFKIATVSDSGTIVMFGLDNFGAPPIVK
jgi:hypothetical protein